MSMLFEFICFTFLCYLISFYFSFIIFLNKKKSINQIVYQAITSTLLASLCIEYTPVFLYYAKIEFLNLGIEINSKLHFIAVFHFIFHFYSTII